MVFGGGLPSENTVLTVENHCSTSEEFTEKHNDVIITKKLKTKMAYNMLLSRF